MLLANVKVLKMEVVVIIVYAKWIRWWLSSKNKH